MNLAKPADTYSTRQRQRQRQSLPSPKSEEYFHKKKNVAKWVHNFFFFFWNVHTNIYFKKKWRIIKIIFFLDDRWNALFLKAFMVFFMKKRISYLDYTHIFLRRDLNEKWPKKKKLFLTSFRTLGRKTKNISLAQKKKKWFSAKNFYHQKGFSARILFFGSWPKYFSRNVGQPNISPFHADCCCGRQHTTTIWSTPPVRYSRGMMLLFEQRQVWGWQAGREGRSWRERQGLQPPSPHQKKICGLLP